MAAAAEGAEGGRGVEHALGRVLLLPRSMRQKEGGVRGAQVTYLPVQADGLVDLQQLKDAIRPETAIVSIMMVNNEIGGRRHSALLRGQRLLISGGISSWTAPVF